MLLSCFPLSLVRQVCFLCLKTRFSIFGQWGVQCKLCQKTVCAKCYTKVRSVFIQPTKKNFISKFITPPSPQMRIPTEHFGNVPVILLSPSLLNSPSNSGTSSPCHLATAAASVQQHNNNYQHYHTMNEMDAFPKTLMERLMRPETDMKVKEKLFINSHDLININLLFRNAGQWEVLLLHRGTITSRRPAPLASAYRSKWRACHCIRRQIHRQCSPAVPKIELLRRSCPGAWRGRVACRFKVQRGPIP